MVMRHSKIYRFCDTTLNRVLEGLKSYNNDVKYGYVQRELTNDEVEYLKLFEEEIKVRLKYRNQMRRWEMYREYDLAHLKLVFEFSIYKVWKSVEYGVSNGLDTAYWGFLGVGTTFDIFQNIILFPYLEYGVLSLSGYGVLVFNPVWSLVSAGTDTPYLLDGYGVLVFRIVIFKISSFKLQNARLLLSFTNYSIITAILKYKRLSNNSLQ
ncbi:hypothetical protein Tco_0592616 [Tanacetum coccineum]